MTASSLAKQLRKIQQEDRIVRGVPAGSFQRPSFLFDQREAADYDDETILALGLEGFNTLAAIDPSLRPFEGRFFSESLINTDLSLLTRKELSELEGPIGTFLMLLSAHFLENSAHKVLEWMVRKWRVNEVYVDELLISILPYHDTIPFIRMVQIVYFKDDSRWNFLLEKVKQGGSPVSRTLLAQRCTVDASLLTKIFCGLTELRTCLSQYPDYPYSGHFVRFVTFITLETLNVTESLKESESIRFYQHLEDLLKMKTCPESLVGAMMLFMSLCERAPLSKVALNLFIRNIIKLSSSVIERQVILTIIRTIEAGFLETLEPSVAISITQMNEAVLKKALDDSPLNGRFLKVLTDSLSTSNDEASIAVGKELFQTFTIST